MSRYVDLIFLTFLVKACGFQYVSIESAIIGDAMPCGRAIRKLNCFDPQTELEDIEILRQRGQDELRGLIFRCQQVNWQAVMAVALDLQQREEIILQRKEFDAQQRQEKVGHRRTNRYDWFTNAPKFLPQNLVKVNTDDEMSMGLLFGKDDSLASHSTTSHNDSSCRSGTLTDDERCDCRSYYVKDEVKF